MWCLSVDKSLLEKILRKVEFFLLLLAFNYSYNLNQLVLVIVCSEKKNTHTHTWYQHLCISKKELIEYSCDAFFKSFILRREVSNELLYWYKWPVCIIKSHKKARPIRYTALAFYLELYLFVANSSTSLFELSCSDCWPLRCSKCHLK